MHNAEYVLVGKSQDEGEKAKIKVYPRRWVVIAIFALFSLINSVHWVQYTIVADLVARYYGIPPSMVDWTSFVFMATIVLLILPVCFLIDKMGMRWSMMIGSFLMAAGAWLKLLGVSPDRFPLVLVGQSAAAIAQLYMVGTPPKIASIWFPPDELSTACAIGVFGNQLGVGIGLMVTPIIVRSHEDPQDIGRDIYLFCIIMAVISTVVMISVAILFKAKPKLPPSPMQALERASPTAVTARSYVRTLARLLRNRNYLLLIMSNSISNAMLSVFVTALNIIILCQFPNGQEFAGRVGLVIILFGLLGCVVYGIILDKTHKYKELMLSVYALMIVASAAFGYSVSLADPIRVYVTAGMLGAFLMGFVPIAFEMSAELTYPESESTTGSLLIIPGNILGIVMTMVFSELLRRWGELYAFSLVCVSLAAGATLSSFIHKDYRRLAANSGDDAKAQVPTTGHKTDPRSP